jgi:hypothetical protein
VCVCVCVCVCRREMIRVVSRGGVWEGLLGRSLLGFMSEEMLI